jgi:uncharacterized protein (DUF2236 family)
MIRTMSTTGSLFPSDEEAQRLLIGPRSITWRYGSDVRMYFAMLYPLLMQVAHPTVGAGVKDYSDFEVRPWNRLFRTLDYVGMLIYGGQDAVAMGRRVRADGQPYYALEPEAYAWVHATLLDVYIAAHQHFARPMGPDQVERFYQEYRGLGRFVGVRERDLPPDWASFREYFDVVVGNTLERTESVDRVLRAVRHAAPPFRRFPPPLWRVVRMPARRALYLGGVGLLPPVLRERFGLPWTRADAAEFGALGATSRSLTRAMPKRALISGPDMLRMRRRAIERGPLGSGDEARPGPPVAAAA